MKVFHGFIGVVVLLGAFTLGIWRLDDESIWHDEAWSIRAIQSPWGTPDDNTPPLYYLVLHLLQRLGAGETPFALRYGSLLIHLLTIALGFRIGCHWYGLTAAFVSGTLLALSPLLWEYAQEVRAYVVVPLIALALLASTDAFLRNRSQFPFRTWFFLWGIELAGLYTHNLSVPLVVWVNGVVLSVLGWRAVRSSEKSFSLILWVSSQGILFLLYLPWLLTQSPSGTPLNTVPRFNAELLKNIWQAYFFPVAASDLPDSFLLKYQFLAIITVLAGVLLLWRERSLKTLLLVSQVVLLPVFSTLLIIRASIDFHPRYYVLGVPAVLLMLAASVHQLPYKTWAGAALVGLAALITWQSLSLIAENRRYQHDDFAAMAAYYAALPADTLIVIPYDHEYTFEVYFKDQIKAHLLNIPLHSTPETAIEKINTALNRTRRVEFLTWFQLPADERGMFPCLLAATSETILETYEVYGLSTTGFILSQPIEMQPLQPEANFNSALRLTGLHYTASEQGICLQSDWTLELAPESEVYQAAARILNPFAWEIAVGNSLILRNDQARVEDWQIGDSGAAFTFMQLPEGTPEMDYDVVLRLYTPQNLSGFDAVNLEGASLGKDLRLPGLTLQGQPVVTTNARIVQDNAREGGIYPGQRLRIEVMSPESDVLILRGESWELRENLNQGLNWVEFTLPAEAAEEAVLALNGSVLKTYPIVQVERRFSPPEFAVPIGAQLGDVAILSGATVTVTEGQMTVALIWRALSTPDVDYRVFVQLLDENGRLLTQSNTMPVQDQRPTSSWLEGEYIVDSHNLQVNGLEYSRLIVGMYNPLTAERVLVLDGTDFIEIPVR